MPIKFRCTHCQQFLGISRAKAGSVTDCPSCGRTIRVPELDGSVKPLPKPKLNLEDAGLSNALNALAGIDQRQRVAVQVSGPELHDDEETVGHRAPVAVAEPQLVQPLPAPIPIEVNAEVRSHKLSPARPAEDVLAEVEELTPPRITKPQPSRGIPVLALIVSLLLSSILFFGVGFVAGRLTVRTPRAAASESIRPEKVASATAPGLVEVLDDWTPALTGRITYLPVAGNPRPDEGARIIVMPEQRSGTVTLPVAGFRAGADEADLQLARSSLRALGGDYAVADADGIYRVQLPTAGSYHVLIISRHQPRTGDTVVDPKLQSVLAEYFDRPASLVGSVAYAFSNFRFQGDEPSPRDHAFAAE